MITLLAIFFVSYFIGSIPFGYLIGRLKGIDVRKHGSGNIGATNVSRVLGRPWGIMVFVCDAGKGVVAVLAAKWLASQYPIVLSDGFPVPAVAGGILAAVLCIVGHNFPVWLGFKGGKGVATSAGVMCGLLPYSSLVGFLIWCLVFFATRYVSIASLVAACGLALSVLVLPGAPGERWPLFTLASLAVLLIFWRHRSNIERLRNGTEHRWGKKKAN